MSSLFPAAGYGGRAWLAPPPCAPRRPANRAPRAGRVHVRRVPAMAAWLARRHLVVNSIVYACWGSRSPSQAPIDHAAPAVNAPSSSCAYGQLLPRRRTEARVRGADHWPPVEHLAQESGPARCKGGASRAPVSVDLCRLPLESGHASCIHAAGVHTQADVPPLVIKAPATHPHHVN